MKVIDITSYTNKTFKHLKALARKNYRDKQGVFIIEGVRILEHAIKIQAEIVQVILSESFYSDKSGQFFLQQLKAWYKSKQIEADVYKMSASMFKEITHTDTPQGIAAVIRTKNISLDQVKVSHNAFYVLCEELQDPGNLGTIIRTADAAGADCVLLSKGCVDVYNPKTVRASMGSLFSMPIIKVENILEASNALKQKGLKFMIGDVTATKQHFEVNMKNSVVLVVGNEAKGVSDKMLALADEKVKIPVIGSAESLNASIAAGILMYEVVRQRMM